MKITQKPDGRAWIVCPYCDCEEVHPNGVKVYPVQGVMAATMTRDGLIVQQSDAADHQRGISIKLWFGCEWGHSWIETLSFHKGTTSIETRLMHDTEGKEDSVEWIQTLWRN